MVEIKVNPYKSIIVENDEGKEITISEGNQIEFALETGEVIRGKVQKLQGKDDKLKIQLLPENKTCEEIWSAVVILDGSLKIYDPSNERE